MVGSSAIERGYRKYFRSLRAVVAVLLWRGLTDTSLLQIFGTKPGGRQILAGTGAQQGALRFGAVATTSTTLSHLKQRLSLQVQSAGSEAPLHRSVPLLSKHLPLK